MNRTTLSPLLICASFLTVNAQLVVTNTQTPAQLVQNVLMGGGVTATNITFNGTSGNSVDQQIASFNSAASNAGIPNGLILSTGNTAQAVGPNNAVRADLAIPGTRTDADLSALSGGLTIDDAAVLEFNFVPTGGSISFNFVFASEEYPGYVCGTVNDAFGFFLSGPGITGPFSNGAMNLALIPGTNVPVTINTVNSGIVGAQGGQAGNCAAIDPNWQANSIHYVDNGNGNNPDANAIRYNGRTVMMTASAQVQCGQQYRLKIAIGDAGDSVYDSAIFLQGGTFASPSISVNATTTDATPLCMAPTTVQAQIGAGATSPYTYSWTQNGVSIGNTQQVTVAASGSSVYQVQVTDACGATATDDIAIQTQPMALVPQPDMTVPCLYEGIVQVELANSGPGQYDYTWTVNGTPVGNTATLDITATQTPTNYTLTVQDECGAIASESILVTMQTYDPMVLTTTPDTTVFCPNDEATVGVLDATGGSGPYTYVWHNAAGDLITLNSSFTISVSTDETYAVTVTDQCGTEAQANVTTLVPVHDVLAVDLGPSFVICAGNTAELVATVTGGSGTYTTEWPSASSTNDMITIQPFTDSTFNVHVTDRCGYEANASIQVTLETPVTEIIATNLQQDDWQFNEVSEPSAVTHNWDLGDGDWSTDPSPDHGYLDLEAHIVELTITTANGCIATDTVHLAPAAHVYFPNAFTPNGDGINDVFQAIGHDLTEAEFTVFDRWGAAMFNSMNMNDGWDGSMMDGNPAPTGVYVIKYSVNGVRLLKTVGLTHVTLLGQETADR